MENSNYIVNHSKLSPYYTVTRIPRKLKKKIKLRSGVHWYNATNDQRLWYYLGETNKDFRDFLISEI